MARKPRIHFPGAFYHVILRGNAKQNIFNGDEDILRFEDFLNQGLKKYDQRLCAYCWMSNHVHMVLQVSAVPLSKMMQVLSQRYTGWFNYRHDRVGHLFQGRYRAILVDGEGYLREVVRYIHLNPVRAEIVTDPLDYAKSSHRAYMALEKARSWLSMEPVLKLFGRTQEAAGAAYRYFMGQRVPDEHLALLRKGGSHGHILGDDAFAQKVQDLNQNGAAMSQTAPVTLDITIDDLIARVAGRYEITPGDILSKSRGRSVVQARVVIAWIAADYTAHTLKDVAGHMGRDISTISRQVNDLRGKMARFSGLRKKITQLTKDIGVRLA